MLMFIIGSAVLGIYFPPLWAVTVILFLAEMLKHKEKDLERANDEIKKEFGENYNEEAKGNPKTGVWTVLLFTIVITLATLTLLGTLTMNLPK